MRKVAAGGRRAADALLGALLLSAAGALLAGPVSGSHTPPNWADTVQASAISFDRDIWQLRARIVDPHGQAVVGDEVLFGVEVDFLGARRISIGEAKSDATGQAMLTYRPTWNGTHHLIAEAQRSDGTSVTVRFTLEVSGVAAPVPRDEPALPFTGAWALPAGVTLVAIVWLVLGGIFIKTVIGIRRARPEPAASMPGPVNSSNPQAAQEADMRPSDRRL